MYTFIFQSLLMCHKNSCSAYLPEPFCHLSFYLMPISHESSHYRFQSNLFPLWTAAVHIKEKKKSKNCTTILSLPNLLRTFNWKGEMATEERQYAYIKKTTTTTGKQNWEITVHYFRYLNCSLKKNKSHFPPTSKKERWSLPLSNIWSSQTTPHRILAKYQFHLPGP